MQSKQVLIARIDLELPEIPSVRRYWALPPGGINPVGVAHPSGSLGRADTSLGLISPEEDLQASYRAHGLELVARSAYAESADWLTLIRPSAQNRRILLPLVFAWVFQSLRGRLPV